VTESDGDFNATMKERRDDAQFIVDLKFVDERKNMSAKRTKAGSISIGMYRTMEPQRLDTRLSISWY